VERAVRKGLVQIDRYHYYTEDFAALGAKPKVDCYRDPTDISTIFCVSREQKKRFFARAVEREIVHVDGKLSEAALAQKKQQRTAIRELREQVDYLRDLDAAGRVDPASAPSPPVMPPSSPAAADGVRQILPWERQLREARARHQAAITPPAPEPIPDMPDPELPAGPTDEEIARAETEQQCGPRKPPEDPGYYLDEIEEAIWRRHRDAWDQQYLENLAALRTRDAATGGKSP
jgi:hypothetical protein